MKRYKYTLWWVIRTCFNLEQDSSVPNCNGSQIHLIHKMPLVWDQEETRVIKDICTYKTSWTYFYHVTIFPSKSLLNRFWWSSMNMTCVHQLNIIKLCSFNILTFNWVQIFDSNKIFVNVLSINQILQSNKTLPCYINFYVLCVTNVSLVEWTNTWIENVQNINLVISLCYLNKWI